MKNHRRISKLSSLYIGPYRVKVEKDPNYVIEVDGTDKTVHADQLKLFLRSGKSYLSSLNNQCDNRSVQFEESSEDEEETTTQRDSQQDGNEKENQVVHTRSGRKITKPDRYRQLLLRVEEC